MQTRTFRWPFVMAFVAIPLVAAACSSSGGSSSNTSTTASGAGAMSLDVGHSSLGSIITDAAGHSLYLFESDTSTTSTCSGGCAATWPPVTTTGQPVAGNGVNAALLGTTTRQDGTTQVTYGGHPLYYYAGDTHVGDVLGEGLQSFGAGWDLVSPAGKKIEKKGG